MEYDTDTIMNRVGELDPKIIEDAVRSMALEFGREKVAGHIARAMNRNLVIDGPEILKYVSGRLSGLKENDLIGLAKDYDMNDPEGLKEIASQLITEDIVDAFADVLVDLVSLGRDNYVRICIGSITDALRTTDCPLTRYAGDYVETYASFLEECLADNDPLKAFIEECPTEK